MKKSLLPLLIASLLFSCTRPSKTEKELGEVLNTQLNLEIFENIQHRNSLMSMQQLRDNHEFLSVVYLQNGCQTCYPKFIEWHKKMDSLDIKGSHSVLFIIQGDSYSDFMQNVLDLDYVEDKYYTIMDPNSQFLNSNKDIPRWMIDASLLIDRDNKIKMVGAPWVNDDMKNLFFKTVTNYQ